MSQGEVSVAQSVKTAEAGVRDLAAAAARVGADAAARAVEITDRVLAEGAGELAQVGRAATKEFGKSTRSARREVRKGSLAARDEVLARAVKMRDPGQKAAQAVASVVGSANESPRRRRKAVTAAKKDLAAALEEARSVARGERTSRPRWPWLLGAGVAAGAVVLVLRVTRKNPLEERENRESAGPGPAAAPVPGEQSAKPAEKPVTKPAEAHAGKNSK